MVPLRSSELLEQKRALRHEMRARREALSDDERRTRAAAACARLLGLPEVGGIGGKTVAGYAAVRGELDPAAALAEFRDRGASIVLPRVDDAQPSIPRAQSGPRLRFHPVAAGVVLQPGRFGIPEPDRLSLVTVAPSAIDVVIVPGVAFDLEGGRVGNGGGYYDAVFSRAAPWRSEALRIGFAYDFQIVDRCPADEHDLPVHLVVTETRVLRPPRGGTAP
jgi:5-formyltetrahydrofolate cyclo-ligase